GINKVHQKKEAIHKMVQSVNQEKLISQDKVDFYEENGFVQVDNVLNSEEIAELKQYTEESLNSKFGRSLNTSKEGQEYYRVLNQKVNSWRDHAGMGKYTFNPKIAQLAREISGFSGIRLFHDQILWKMPKDSKETPWHQDFPYWPMNEH